MNKLGEHAGDTFWIGDKFPQSESREEIEIKWKTFTDKYPELLETCKRIEGMDYDDILAYRDYTENNEGLINNVISIAMPDVSTLDKIDELYKHNLKLNKEFTAELLEKHRESN